MSLITSLFGEGAANFWTVTLALAFVLVLIVFMVWVLKFILSASRTVGLGRNRRIGVTDSIPIDAKRHLVLVRRDDVEHLILTGGTHDLVIEAAIPLAVSSDDKPARSAAATRRSGLSLGGLARGRGTPPGLDRKLPAENKPAAEKARLPGLPLAPGLRRRKSEADTPTPPVAPQAIPARDRSGAANDEKTESDGQLSTGMSALAKLREMAKGRTAPQTGTSSAASGIAPDVGSNVAPGILRPVTRHQPAPRPKEPNNSGDAAADSDMSGRDAPVRRQENQPFAAGGPKPGPATQSGAAIKSGPVQGPAGSDGNPAPTVPDPADWQSANQPPNHRTGTKAKQ